MWNKLYEEYLGVKPNNDSEGILQDVHWASGFGYFPTYALGNAYNAMYILEMQKDFDVFKAVENGEMHKINAWMKEHVFKNASVLDPNDWIKSICDKELDSTPYLDYLEEKYSKKKKSDTEVIEFSKKESSEVDNLNRHIRIDGNNIERKETVNSRGAISIFTKLAIKTKSRRNLVKLVIEGELDKNQLIQIKSAIEKGLTESQLEEIINGRISAERMKEIIDIAELENSMNG